MIEKFLRTILICGMVTACTGKPAVQENEILGLPDTTAEAQAKKLFSMSPVFRQVTDELGTYKSLEHFELKRENISEFRIELLNIYNEEDLQKSLNIIEVTWSYNFFENVTIWFQQDSLAWRKVDDTIWSKGAEF
jgi:hypothetical protein